MRAGRTMTPGFSRPSGSHAAFSSAKAPTSCGPYMRSRNSERDRPSPCSPESDPPSSTTRSATRSAMRRIRDDVARLARVERGAHVQAADRRMPVEAGPGALALQQLLEAHDELLQALRGDGGVLDERDGLRGLGPAEQQREDRRPQAHRPRLVGWLRQERHVLGADVAAERRAACQALGDLLGGPAPLDEQQGGRVACDERGAVAPEAVRARVLDRDAVEQLDGARALARAGAGSRGRPPRGSGTAATPSRGPGGSGRRRSVRARGHRERALAAADEAGEVERVRVQQRIEPVAGHAAQDVRVATADLVAVAVGELQGVAQQAQRGGRRPAPCGPPPRAASAPGRRWRRR